MTATVDGGRPERVWAVAPVPPARTARHSRPDEPPPLPQAQPGPRTPAGAPAGPPPSARPRRAWPARLRTGLVVLALIAGAGAGGYHIVGQRLAARAFVDLGGVILTAEAVPVGFAEAVVVTSIGVVAHARVSAGQGLAQVTTATGQAETLKAPADGTVAAIKVSVGGVAHGGEPIVTLYDQARLTFTAAVPVSQLRRLRLGMTAYVDGPGLAGRIAARVDHVVPIVGAGQPSTSDTLTVVLVPSAEDRGTVGTLVPGLPLHAVVDTNTAPGALPAVNAG